MPALQSTLSPKKRRRTVNHHRPPPRGQIRQVPSIADLHPRRHPPAPDQPRPLPSPTAGRWGSRSRRGRHRHRRSRRPGDGGGVTTKAYGPDERITLSTYRRGRPATRAASPEVIFAASARRGRSARTLGARGRRPIETASPAPSAAVSSAAPRSGPRPNVGPDPGSSPRLRRGLTVQGAVALNSAALAASVDTQNTKWHETLFAVTGARLAHGCRSQFPGQSAATRPTVVRARPAQGAADELPAARAVRPASADAPLVRVSDGGFYDNLGLIERFRRGSTPIYCFDASGDNPPRRSTAVVGRVRSAAGPDPTQVPPVRARPACRAG